MIVLPRNLQTARTFLTAVQQGDAETVAALLAPDVVELLPFAPSGTTEPAATFEGRDAVAQVQAVIASTFSTVEFLDPRWTESRDGQTVFVETLGRRVQRSSNRVYENVYVLKFEFRDRLIRRITEYSNPVAFARFFGRPLGEDRG